MIKLLERFFKSKDTKDTITFLPQTITFEYARANPEVQVMLCNRRGLLEPVEVVEPFAGFKAKTISDVKKIDTGPGVKEITSKNVMNFIEEPCIPAFLKLQNLGIQTHWASANYGNNFAIISVIPKTLSEKNFAIAESLNLQHSFDGFGLEFPIKSTDAVQEVSDKFLKLCNHFVAQPVLYGQKNQTEYLNAYLRYNNSSIAETSNIDTNYISDHLNYLLTNFPQYITFDKETYSCINMPDELFQKEILDRDILRKIYCLEPSACINGIVWASRELYDINERNTRHNLDETDGDRKGTVYTDSIKVIPSDTNGTPVAVERLGIQQEQDER